jgi:hypothetical protein
MAKGSKDCAYSASGGGKNATPIKAKAMPGKSGKSAPMPDNRAGRMQSVDTDRGTFRFKKNRKDDD